MKSSAANIQYRRKVEGIKARSLALVAAAQDIAPLPAVVNPIRRARADRDFRFFCETHFSKLFTLAWSLDHLRVIAKIERTVIHHETFAVAMPRGSGKTTLCQIAVLWAVLTGRHRFVMLIASTAEYALSMLNNLKTHLSGNDLLFEDYPEACYPIRKLEGESRRCSGQRYYGVPTRITWAMDEISLPCIPRSRCAGAVVRVSGLTGNIRGAMHVTAEGVSIRPTLAVIDDPQTDQSARSPLQVHERLSIINGAVAGLAGPGKSIARIVPCTVIRADDLADQLLNRKKNPQWHGERTKLVYSFPTNDRLWGEYARIRAESHQADGDGHEATDFYRQHREAMDTGAQMAWPERFNTDEISAVQYAMNLKISNEAAFFAEYQNEPLPEVENQGDLLTVDDLMAKTNGHERGEVPLGCNRLTCFVDVHGPLLYWLTCAWEDDFSGYIVDYGVFPDQRRGYFTLRDAKITLERSYPKAGLEGRIYAGLEALTSTILSREWRRDDGAMLRIERCMVDANWGNSTDTVYQFCRQSAHAQVLLPSHGKYVGAASRPFSEYTRHPGERVGLSWRMPSVKGKRAVRYVLIDTNFWKSFVQARFAVPMGDPGCLSLYGHKPETHRLLAEHLTSEYRVTTQGRGRTVDEWKTKAGDPDNHWLDCLVGCAVGASMQGCELFGAGAKITERKRIKLSDLQKGKNR